MCKDHDARPRCIVLPFQDRRAPATGLALHFLLGNVVAGHIGFKECWFGWRAAKIFPQAEEMMRYCRGRAPELDRRLFVKAPDVSCWVSAKMEPDSVTLNFFDARTQASSPASSTCAFTCADHLKGFRQCFCGLLERCGHPLPRRRRPMLLWPEIIDPAGLRRVGRALEAFYAHGFSDARKAIDPSPFAAAVQAAPESFMAHDLLGWAHYRNHNIAQAKSAFFRALALNPHAVGPMGGLTGCAVLENDRDAALTWAARKAAIRHEDAAAAMEKVRRKFQP
jgi:hypothetical protein